MPLILVVEQEQRYVERISEALGSYGWTVEGVADRASALRFVAKQPASLLVVNSEAKGSFKLVESFSRRAGGPGTVLLIPESAGEEMAKFDADEVIQKPFTAKAIRQAVRRCLTEGSKEGELMPQAKDKGAVAKEGDDRGRSDRPPATVAIGAAAGGQAPAVSQPSDGAALLTSEDIFGDVVSELESAISSGSFAAVGGAEAATAQAVLVEPEPESAPEEATSSEPAVELSAVVELPVEEEAAAPPSEPDTVQTEAAESAAEAVESEVDEWAEVEDTGVSAAAQDAVDVHEPDQGSADSRSEAADDVAVDEDEEAALEAESVDEGTDDGDVEAEMAAAAPVETEEPPAEPRPDPAKTLDARIRQAAEEGKRLSAQSSRAIEDARPESADDLLRNVLSGIDASDDPVTAPRRASKEEVDALLSTVVVHTGAAAAANAPESGETEEVAGEDPPYEEAAYSAESAVLEVIGEPQEQGLAGRLKLILVIVIIVAMALLAFVFAGRIVTETRASPGGAGASLERPASQPMGETEVDESMQGVEEEGSGSVSSSDDESPSSR